MALHRHEPDGRPIVFGGNFYRAPNGMRAIHLTTTAQRPTPDSMRDLYSRALRQMSPADWDGQEIEGSLIIYWTDPIKFVCSAGGCGHPLGEYCAYDARGEYGIVAHTARRYLDAQAKSVSVDAHDRTQPKNARYWLTGNSAKTSSQTYANFRCRRCGHQSSRRLDRLGQLLFQVQSSTYELQ